jgi:hypothetical protein
LASTKDTEMEDKAKTEDTQDNMRWFWFYDKHRFGFPGKKCGGSACFSKYFIPSNDEHRTSLESMEQFLLIHKCISRRNGRSEKHICSRGNEKRKENKIMEISGLDDFILMYTSQIRNCENRTLVVSYITISERIKCHM